MRGKCSPLAGPWESLHRQNKGTTVQFYRGVPPLVRMKSLLTGPPHSRIIQVKDVKIMLDEKDYKEIAHLFKVIIEYVGRIRCTQNVGEDNAAQSPDSSAKGGGGSQSRPQTQRMRFTEPGLQGAKKANCLS